MSPSVTTIKQRAVIAAAPSEVYDALVTAKTHAAFTGAPAAGAKRVGGRFSAYDGYITGVHRVLVPGRRIVQEWTTTEWPAGAPPSTVEIALKRVKGGTELRMTHSNVPASQAARYRRGWIEYYWSPLKAYFESRPSARTAETRRRSTGRAGARTTKRTGR